jgi:hypothetical protein
MPSPTCAMFDRNTGCWAPISVVITLQVSVVLFLPFLTFFLSSFLPSFLASVLAILLIASKCNCSQFFLLLSCFLSLSLSLARALWLSLSLPCSLALTFSFSPHPLVPIIPPRSIGTQDLLIIHCPNRVGGHGAGRSSPNRA